MIEVNLNLIDELKF